MARGLARALPGEYLPPGEAAQMLIDRATEIIVQAIDGLVAISGTAGFGETNPIQRAWRDIHFASMHVSLNADINYGHFARMQFGVLPDPGQPYFVKV